MMGNDLELDQAVGFINRGFIINSTILTLAEKYLNNAWCTSEAIGNIFRNFLSDYKTATSLSDPWFG